MKSATSSRSTSPGSGRSAPALVAPDAVQGLADTFSALGDPTRVRILDALSHGELCVCDLAAVLSLSQSAVSHQLRLLRGMRLVRPRRDGRIVFYSLDDQHIMSLFRQTLQHVEESASVRLAKPLRPPPRPRRFGEAGCEGVAMEAAHAIGCSHCETNRRRPARAFAAGSRQSRPASWSWRADSAWFTALPGLGDPALPGRDHRRLGVPGAARLAIDHARLARHQRADGDRRDRRGRDPRIRRSGDGGVAVRARRSGSRRRASIARARRSASCIDLAPPRGAGARSTPASGSSRIEQVDPGALMIVKPGEKLRARRHRPQRALRRQPGADHRRVAAGRESSKATKCLPAPSTAMAR